MRSNVINKWYYDVVERDQLKGPSHNRARSFLYDLFYRNITQHNLIECYKLLRLLVKDTTLDPYIIFRFVFILIESVDTEEVNKNFIIYLESLLSKLDLAKPDVFVEFLAYFIKNNRINDARELFAQRHRSMCHRTHRPLPFVDVNLGCYEFLLNYLEWDRQIAHQDIQFDVSIQGWIVNAIDRLKTTSSNYEYFVMCVVRVLLFYGFNKKAYLFVSEFQRNNPDNLSAQLLLFNLLNKFEMMSHDTNLKQESHHYVSMICDSKEIECVQNRSHELEGINNFSLSEVSETFELEKYPISVDRKDILRNLRRLDSRRDEILELAVMFGNKVELIQDIMDSLEFVSVIRDASRWVVLNDILSETISSEDDALIREVQCLWQTRYQRLWHSVDFLSIVDTQLPIKKLISDVLTLLSTNFDGPENTFEVDELFE